MTRRGKFEFQVWRLEPVGGPVPFPLQRLFIGTDRERQQSAVA